ncbi:MAG TPA: hypothetical protein P5096_02015 [Patescibacteria group bacterium]|nr:hypothetical protein [Patescibacteria group bacterium]
MGKKKIFIIIGVVVVFIVVIVIIAKLSSSTTSTPEVVNNSSALPVTIILGKGVVNKQLVNKTDAFLVTDKEINAAIYYNSLPAGSLVEYQWYNFRSGKNIVVTPRITTRTTAIQSSTNPDFAKLTNDGKKIVWGPGEYAFRIAIDTVAIDPETGKTLAPKKTLYERRYNVYTQTEMDKINTINAFTSFSLTTAVDTKGNLKEKSTTTFSPTTSDIYAVIKYDGIPTQAHFEAKWIYLAADRQIDSFDKYISGSGSVVFNINAKEDIWTPVKEWPKGQYQLQLLINGEDFKNIDFSVE